MDRLVSLEKSFKKVTYIMKSNVRPPLPEFSIEEVLTDCSRVISYVNYFLSGVDSAFREKLADSPERHGELFEKREVFFKVTYSVWIAVTFQLCQPVIGLELLKKMKELGRFLSKNTEEDMPIHGVKNIIYFYSSNELDKVVNSKEDLPDKGFLLYPLYDFARYNPSLKHALQTTQNDLLELQNDVKYNNRRIEDDFEEYDLFCSKRLNLYDLKLLTKKPQDT